MTNLKLPPAVRRMISLNMMKIQRHSLSVSLVFRDENFPWIRGNPRILVHSGSIL